MRVELEVIRLAAMESRDVAARPSRAFAVNGIKLEHAHSRMSSPLVHHRRLAHGFMFLKHQSHVHPRRILGFAKQLGQGLVELGVAVRGDAHEDGVAGVRHRWDTRVLPQQRAWAGVPAAGSNRSNQSIRAHTRYTIYFSIVVVLSLLPAIIAGYFVLRAECRKLLSCLIVLVVYCNLPNTP